MKKNKIINKYITPTFIGMVTVAIVTGVLNLYNTHTASKLKLNEIKTEANVDINNIEIKNRIEEYTDNLKILEIYVTDIQNLYKKSVENIENFTEEDTIKIDTIYNSIDQKINFENEFGDELKS